jgi:hypothetical protein
MPKKRGDTIDLQPNTGNTDALDRYIGWISSRASRLYRLPLDRLRDI